MYNRASPVSGNLGLVEVAMGASRRCNCIGVYSEAIMMMMMKKKKKKGPKEVPGNGSVWYANTGQTIPSRTWMNREKNEERESLTVFAHAKGRNRTAISDNPSSTYGDELSYLALLYRVAGQFKSRVEQDAFIMN
jgi:hypothetical protein